MKKTRIRLAIAGLGAGKFHLERFQKEPRTEVAALKKGCHVLCKKAPASDLAGAKRMGAAAKRDGREIRIR
jgi:predicted dehydrogenase